MISSPAGIELQHDGELVDGDPLEGADDADRNGPASVAFDGLRQAVVDGDAVEQERLQPAIVVATKPLNGSQNPSLQTSTASSPETAVVPAVTVNGSNGPCRLSRRARRTRRGS